MACSGGGSGSGGGGAGTTSGGSSGSSGNTGGSGTVPTGPSFAVVIETPIQAEGGHAEIVYQAIDAASQPGALAVEYSLDGGATYAPALEGIGSDGFANLTSSPFPGTRHVFTWDTFGAFGESYKHSVIAKITWTSATGTDTQTTSTFAINNGTAPGAAPLTRGPYLQDVTPTSVKVIWRTGQAVSSSIEYGDTEALGQVINGGSGVEHHVRIPGLNPGQRYFYRVMVAGVPRTETVSFRTAPLAHQGPFSFLAFGDSGKASAPQWDTAQGIEMASKDADFLIHTGDVIYPGGEARYFDPKFFSPYQKTLMRLPSYLAIGNHDVKTMFAQPFLDAFHLPTQSSGKEQYYTFMYGDAQFFCLDTSYTYLVAPGLPQLTWFIDELRRSTATWKIVFFHHPPYSSGSHGSDTVTRFSLSPHLEQYGVDLVLNGHDHHYERTSPRRDYAGNSRGTVYIVTGAGGQLTGSPSPSDSFTASKANQLHFMHFTIDGNRLHGEARGIDNTVIDAFDIVK
ncbi:MAG: purple acid phosphatase family protein [Planctomycetota bacterium]